jgi:hypothetical protein
MSKESAKETNIKYSCIDIHKGLIFEYKNKKWICKVPNELDLLILWKIYILSGTARFYYAVTSNHSLEAYHFHHK